VRERKRILKGVGHLISRKSRNRLHTVAVPVHPASSIVWHSTRDLSSLSLERERDLGFKLG
jgi:hypothetical protein